MAIGIVVALVAVAIGAAHPGARASIETPHPRVEPFPLTQVRLLDGPFARAQEVNRQYIRALEVDRLLAPFRLEAGLAPKAKGYPNWEATGLQGHTAGHYLTALAQVWASTGDAGREGAARHMVRELAECQRANGNGYVGGIPAAATALDEVVAGTMKVENFAAQRQVGPLVQPAQDVRRPARRLS